MAGAGALAVGCVSGAHGVRGALRLRLHDPDSTSLREGMEVQLRDADGGDRGRYTVARVAPKPGSATVRLWLDGVEGREDAESLRGLDVWVDRDDLEALEDDEFYLADAIGRRVERESSESGGGTQALGVVIGVTTNGVQDLFEVAYGDDTNRRSPRTWLLPVLPQFLVEIDEQRILVDLPEGMLPSQLERS